ncbi:hypothetical protein [Streptomyces sp. NPDC058084]|uniref:hypothetical protein n=1 Tax=Streptomyces sp. NPDC058084 TaxID=3346333 RepID=UPI0036E781B1
MTDTTAFSTEPLDDEETPPSVPDTLEALAQMYLRTVALPLPRNPATFGWQATAGALAALSARLLHFVSTAAPAQAAAFADFYHGHLGDGPHPLAVGRWLQHVVADTAGADFDAWVEQAKKQAEEAFAYTSRPAGIADLGAQLGDDVLSLLISGLGASRKEWEENGSERRSCVVPGCPRDFSLTDAWTGKDGAHSEGWLSASAVGFACPKHATFLWGGDHQHIPRWKAVDGDSERLACTCGWTSGTVRFRAHATVLYQAHALEIVEPKA